MTRRILFASASALALLLAGTAGVQAADVKTKQFVITGTVPQACTLGGFSKTSGPGTYDDTSGSLAFNLDTDTDADLDDFVIELTANASCNFNNKVTLTSANSGLLNTAGPAPSPFADLVDYLATVTWDTVSVVSLDTSGSPGTSADGNTSGAVSGDLVVKIQNTTTPGTLLLAGSFQDTLTLSIGNDI